MIMLRYSIRFQLLLFIVYCLFVFEVHGLRRLHNHNADETPIEISNQDHKLGSILSLRTEDSLTEKDAVKNIRKGDLLTLNTGDR